jgi:uncharacterized membrane protein
VKGERSRPLRIALILVLLVDGVVFLAASLLNWGTHIPLGFVTLRFSPAVWQAGIGELVVAVALLAAALSRRMMFSWVAFWLSVAGIAVGLLSHQVQGAARSVHIVLVPLAIILLALLLANRAERTQSLPGRPSRT